MNPQQSKDLIRRYFEALSGLDQYAAEPSLKDHIAMYEAAFPEYDMRIDQMVAEGDLVSVIGRGSGTHTGTCMGLPPTGKSWDVPLPITYRVMSGKIVEHWLLVDTAAFMQQLGLIPSVASIEGGG